LENGGESTRGEPYLTHLQVFPQSLGTVLGGKHLFRGKGAKAEDSK
jgi:hypothetical protein